MRSAGVDGFPRISMWQRVREYAVPLSMINDSTRRRLAGDWVGACVAARIDVDLDVDAVGRRHGGGTAAAVLGDLARLAPDLLRWHMPRVAPDGLLRPGLTVALAGYPGSGGWLVVRTPPAWAAGPQRMSLAWWDGRADPSHPHPRPHPRFRFDLHRHLWDARRADELRRRGGDPHKTADGVGAAAAIPADWAVDRWAAEAAILLDADGGDAVEVRLGAQRSLVLRGDSEGRMEPVDPARVAQVAGAPGRRPRRAGAALPVLPEAAVRVPPDVLLLRAGLIGPGELHPLVAEALTVPSARSGREPEAAGERLVECRGATHRIAVVDGVLTALDHDPDTIRREELLATLTGTALPCLRVIDQLHRAPSQLADVRARLDHGDVASAVAVVESLLGPEAVLRAGDLQTALASADASRRAYDVYRAPDGDSPPDAGSVAALGHRLSRLHPVPPSRPPRRRSSSIR